MIFLVCYLGGIVTAVLRYFIDTRNRDKAPEFFARYMLGVGYGVGGVLGFIGHRYRANEVAKSIGWPEGSPFQQEMAFANLGVGVLGLVSIFVNDGFWLATAISGAVLYLGAAKVHIHELRNSKNFSPNNVGAILPDILLPITMIGMLIYNRRSRKQLSV